MTRMFVRHPVSDFAQWKKVYDEFEDERRSMGVKDAEVFTATENPTDVTVWHDFESESAARQFVESPRLREVMDRAGVAGEPTIWFTEKA